MNINQLKPVNELVKQFGVKVLAYGPPGSGKTPLIKTAPNPVVCAVEPGLLSLRDSNIPTWACFEKNIVDPNKIDEFFEWLFKSDEVRNYDTVCLDSISHLAEIFLEQEVKRNKDGRKAYGEMCRRVMNIANGLFYMQNMNVYMIAKQTIADENGTTTKRPYFPGKKIDVDIPHLYDEIWHIAKTNVPGVLGEVVAVRTQETFGITARDRSGKLAELEQPHLGNLFAKCMS